MQRRGLRQFLVYLLAGLLATAFSPAFLASQPVADSAERLFSSASDNYASGFFVRSGQEFREFRHRYPEHHNVPEALFGQARASLAAGYADEAIALFELFQGRYPWHPLAFEARLSLGMYFFESGEYAGALETLAHVVERDLDHETSARALYWMGESALKSGSFDRAIGYFSQAAEDYRETATAPSALYAVAHAHASAGQYAESVRAFENLAARYPDSPLVRDIGLAQAEAYYELGDYSRVVDEIEARYPRLSGAGAERATFLLAEAFNHLRRSDDAIVHYRRFTEEYTDSPYYRRAVYGLGWNYHREGAYQWAANEFAVVQREDDELAERAAYYQGINLSLAGQHRRAVQVLESAAERWPNGAINDKTLFELGMARYQSRDWAGAVSAFEDLVRKHPSSELIGEGQRMLAESRVAVGDFDGAFIAYDAAATENAAAEDLRDQAAFQKAWLLFRRDRFSESGPAFMRLYRDDPVGDQAADALFWAAESYYQTGAFERARTLFTDYLTEFPRHRHGAAAHYALGWCYFRLGQYGGAVLEFGRFLTAYRSQEDLEFYIADARLRLGDSYYALKQYRDAIRTYRSVEGDERDYAMYQVAQSYTQLGETESAIETFDAMLERFPYSEWREEAVYSTGYLRFLNQDYEGAIAEYEDLIRRFPEHTLASRSQYGIGDAYYNAGLFAEAEEAYRVVLTAYPNDPLVLDAVGGIQYALVALEREDDLDIIIERFVEGHPNSPVIDPLRFKQAELSYQNGEFETALDLFQYYLSVARARDMFPDTYLLMGRSYIELGQTEEAETSLLKITDEYPNHPLSAEAHQELGGLYLEQNRFRAALNVYRNLGSETDNAKIRAESMYGQGMALLGLDRAAEAESLLSDALELDATSPSSDLARLGLGRVYQQTGRSDEARSMYRTASDRNRDEVGAESLYRLGVLLIEEGDAARALVELGRIPVLFPSFVEWEARGYLAQARAYVMLDQRGDADRIYDLVIDSYPGTEFADEARREKSLL